MNPFLQQKRISYSQAGPRGTAVFSVGARSFPYLADHGFQDLAVLPGAFLLEMACCLHLDCIHASLGRISHAEFLQPLLLSDPEISIRVECERIDTEAVRYSFHEAGALNAGAAPCATLEIERASVRPPPSPRSRLRAETFPLRPDNLGDASAFYRRLRENGNRYGPQFQGLRGLSREADNALGRLVVPAAAAESGPYHLHPVLVDSAIQLLAAFFLDRGKTFVLRGIEEVILQRTGVPGPSWVYGTLRPGSPAGPDEWIGDLEIRDDSGACWIQLRGVKATCLEQGQAPKGPAEAAAEFVVAATFTAEPIAETLQFWSDYFSLPTRVSFAPYNQVFQQLLDPGSPFHRNHGGFNALLLNLADWAGARPAPRAPAGPGRHLLPNGLEIAHLNRHETEFVYREIFDDRCYLQHGIDLSGAATVIDIGANIGLFSLFVRGECPDASVYAYEPNPAAYRALQANCEAYGPRLHPFNAGVSDRRGRAPFTAYEKSSVFSSFHPDPQEDRRAIRTVISNLLPGGSRADPAADEPALEELMAQRMDQRTFECPLLSVSDIIREHGLDRVDLLKIDAEKCELEVLRGIEDIHWPSIFQVVIEVHDRTGRVLRAVQAILAERGFRCAVGADPRLAGTGLCNVYAVRREAPLRSEPSVPAALLADLQGKVETFAQALETFARTSAASTLVCFCPCGPNRARGPAFDRLLAASEERLLLRLRSLPQVHPIGSKEILRRYPAAEFHQPPSEGGGHLPYTPEGFAAIGTSLFRTSVALRRPPFKLIVLDCDHTLWQGGCGEDGPLAVTVTPAHRHLQEFLIRQREAGMILCLCSKNDEADVWAVFQRNPEMALARGHLSSARINWAPKSENLRSLAEEFNLGLDSLIFLDDNPAECAEVRAHCPGTLVLQAPSDPAAWPHLLDHVWPFDHPRITVEDRKRPQRAREEEQRWRYRERATSLQDFIAGLGLEVSVFEPPSDQLSRLSQLTFRTNQFNFSTRRRTEGELKRFLEADGGRCLAVDVRDRFGDYGIVGLLLGQSVGDRWRVDTFLLSCRVLGRGVEHRVLAELGRRAQREGKNWVELVFLATERNQPAGDFIRSIGAEFMRPFPGGASFRLPASRLAELRYQAPAAAPGGKRGGPGRTPGVAAEGLSGAAEKFAEIAAHLAGAKEIAAASEAHRLRGAGFGEPSAESEPPATLEGKLLRLYRKALANPRIGPNDNFLEAGGTSLQAVQVAAAIRRELRLPVSVVALFECPTVRLLCEKLQPGAGRTDAADEARERGARRNRRREKRSA